MLTQPLTLPHLAPYRENQHAFCLVTGTMLDLHPDSSLPLILANLLLAVFVGIPLLLVGAAILREAVDKIRRRRSIVWMEIEGVGRIPVLKE